MKDEEGRLDWQSGEGTSTRGKKRHLISRSRVTESRMTGSPASAGSKPQRPRDNQEHSNLALEQFATGPGAAAGQMDCIHIDIVYILC